MSEFTMLIQSEELAAILADDHCRVLDCRFNLADPARGYEEYKAGHIPAATHVDLDRDLAGPVTAATGRHPLPDPSGFAALLGRRGIGNDNQVVVYDGGSGAIAARAWWMLRWLGHDRVALLDGGISRWTAEGRPLEQGVAPAAKARRFVPAERKERIKTTAELEAAVARGGGFCLVDARDERRFRGEAEPLDPVAGHIPGARNFPLGRSLKPDASWESPGALSRAWRPVLGEPPGEPWTAMCGSGVTACHLVLSARLAGYQEPTLYAGSWSEWIRNPERPVATGR